MTAYIKSPPCSLTNLVRLARPEVGPGLREQGHSADDDSSRTRAASGAQAGYGGDPTKHPTATTDAIIRSACKRLSSLSTHPSGRPAAAFSVRAPDWSPACKANKPPPQWTDRAGQRQTACRQSKRRAESIKRKFTCSAPGPRLAIASAAGGGR